MDVAKKNSVAVAFGRKGRIKGGPARAAKLTPEQQSGDMALKKQHPGTIKRLGGLRKQIRKAAPTTPADTSDNALATLLRRLKATGDADEIKRLSDQIERVVFHKQFTNA